MGIFVECECGQRLGVRVDQVGKNLRCPRCGQVHRINQPIDVDDDRGHAESAEENLPKPKGRELLLWSGFATGLILFVILALILVNRHQRNLANQEVLSHIAEAKTLLGKNQHDDAIYLLEKTLQAPRATDFADAKQVLDQARMMKQNAIASKQIETAERLLNEREIEAAINKLKACKESMPGPYKRRANAIIDNVRLATSMETARSRVSKLSDAALNSAEVTAGSLAARFPINYPSVRERYKQNLLDSIPAERTRREERKRKEELERQAKLERERFEQEAKLEQKRQEKLEEEIRVAEAERNRLAEEARVLEERMAKERLRLALEEDRKRVLRGFGTTATRSFALSEGLAIVTLKHRGSSNFIVTMLDDDGDPVNMFANTIGSDSISKAVRVRKDGEYLLNIKADGIWEVVITQPLPHETEPAFLFDGIGTKATRQFKMKNGLCKMKLKHEGEGNFIVQLLDDEGRAIALVANEIGGYEGSEAVKIPKKGTYIFDVTAGGKWSIEIE